MSDLNMMNYHRCRPKEGSYSFTRPGRTASRLLVDHIQGLRIAFQVFQQESVLRELGPVSVRFLSECLIR
jgi:hypothetical protein